MTWWVRPDGAVRWLEHIDGPPAELPPPTAWERFGDRVEVLRERLARGDDVMTLALLLFVVPSVILALP
ncbi:MAG TPA: hypothetical protein VGL20_14915 [Candidatus Dormibacteraeota bacterium]|jgi:hypothetical protein